MKVGFQRQFLGIVVLTIFLVVSYLCSLNLLNENSGPSEISELTSFVQLQTMKNVTDNFTLSKDQNFLATKGIFHPDMEVYAKTIERFDKRNQFLKRQCKLLNLTESYANYDYFLKERMLYEKSHDFFVCLVAKCAASTWRFHLEMINRKLGNNNTELKKREKDKLSFSFKTTKVFTVRNPTERLISAYRDKFGDGHEYPSTETKKRWYDYAERTLDKKLGNHQHRSLTFSDYINIVMTNIPRNDKHFRSVYSNCVPCKVDYDYIVHQETFSEDLMYLFHVLNVTESSVDVHENLSGINNRSSEHYLRQLNSDQLLDIYDLLWTDFYLFDYPVPNRIKEALEGNGRIMFRQNTY